RKLRMRIRKRRIMNLALLPVLFIALGSGGTFAQSPKFEVTIPAAVHAGPLTGRLVLILAKSAQPEPRMAISPQGPAIFGVDLEQLEPGRAAIVDASATAYPAPLSSLPPGEYFAQAVINVYDRVQRADGHTLWLPMTDGTIEFFTVAPGNLYSDPQQVRVGQGSTVRIEITRVLPPATPPVDTDWIKHVRIQSEKLTRFWGRPTFIYATVLLPNGYAANPQVRYPAIYAFGHNVPFSFNPDSARTRNIGQIHPITGVETGYDFYKAWTSDDFPRVIAITMQQSTPYFPDSYSVNSANNGPYGDAIVEEVIPQLERTFRIIGKSYARIVEGASTSGWQSLSLQLRYPDYFGGAWILQPDPIDFRRYQITDIYEDENAFTMRRGDLIVERPFRRTTEGQVVWTARQVSMFEDVLGSRGRSGYQLEGWEAVYGPVGEDGYPRPLWDKQTGRIDRVVAHYMRANGYDLREYAQRNWPTLGPKLAGKLHFFAGDMDDFYLNLAVYRFEDFVKSTTNPRSDAQFTYGRPMKGHSWHAFPWAELVRKVAVYVRENAPAGENVESWRR
ncbi:MAG: alpha/beta hydrolase-fold protein, partial [Longimicrobiales bacterium]